MRSGRDMGGTAGSGMKILVPVKQVSILDDQVELDGSAVLDNDALEWEVNEWDTFSLEAALQLAEAEPGSEVVAVTIGGQEAEEGLLACLAKGADRAIQVDDPCLANADSLAVAAALAAVARREAPDLIVCGVQSSDTAQATTGVALAGLLDIAHVAVINALEKDDQQITVQRELEGGTVEVLRVRLPALLTVQTGTNKPRYATLRAIKQAQAKPYERLGLTDVGLSPADIETSTGSRTRNLSFRRQDAAATMLDGPPGEIATRILEIVQEAMQR